MTLPIFLYGHPVLRQTSKEITPDYNGLKELITNMYDTMYESEGVGLAAPQVGLNERIVVIDANPVADSFPECANRRLTLINPKVEVLDGEKINRAEGCLSLPGLSENVCRIENIRLTWMDEEFNSHEEIMTGFLARIVQHECDHLEGLMYIDHITPIRKQLIKNKLRNIASGKIYVDYPVRFAPKQR